jgi:hypothetical protein
MRLFVFWQPPAPLLNEARDKVDFSVHILSSFILHDMPEFVSGKR